MGGAVLLGLRRSRQCIRRSRRYLSCWGDGEGKVKEDSPPSIPSDMERKSSSLTLERYELLECYFGEDAFPFFEGILYLNGSSCVGLVMASEQPVIAYTQKTWKLASGEPMHSESGYWRPKPDGAIEVVLAQSTGIVEVQVPRLLKNRRAAKAFKLLHYSQVELKKVESGKGFLEILSMVFPDKLL